MCTFSLSFLLKKLVGCLGSPAAILVVWHFADDKMRLLEHIVDGGVGSSQDLGLGKVFLEGLDIVWLRGVMLTHILFECGSVVLLYYLPTL